MLSRPEIIEYLEERVPAVVQELYREADRVRMEEVGDVIHLRGIIEFSNICRRNCEYCGLRRDNRHVFRYRMSVPEILETAREARELGMRTVVLQSGEETGYTLDGLCDLVRGIKDLGVAVTLSIGERPRDDYMRLKDAGADRYLLRFETSDPVLFARLKPDGDYRRRFLCLEWLREAGYQVGSGIMVGLPGQSVESLADDILKFRELDLDMIGLGPFISHPDTPLDGCPNGTMEQVLRVTALTRIVARNVHIPATTATGTIDPMGRQKALRCGANVIMPNVTPTRFREHYLLYPGKICIDDDPRRCRHCVDNIVASLGRVPGADAGHSPKSGRVRDDAGNGLKGVA